MPATVHDEIANARRALAQAGLAAEDAAFDAELLARHVLGWDRTRLITHGGAPAPADFSQQFAALIDRRTAREPTAFIIGHREFWGLDFEVTPDVLIPRPETELIVEQAIAFATSHGPYGRIIDVGTGSGCLAVALATEFPSAQVVATDRSMAALVVARRNASRLVGGRVQFVCGDLLECFGRVADLIVANPPYIPLTDAAHLQPEVGRYEPITALFGGHDGLAVIRRIFETASEHLAPRGHLVVEFGFGQAEAVPTLAESNGWSVEALAPDLQGIPRAIVLVPSA